MGLRRILRFIAIRSKLYTRFWSIWEVIKMRKESLAIFLNWICFKKLNCLTSLSKFFRQSKSQISKLLFGSRSKNTSTSTPTTRWSKKWLCQLMSRILKNYKLFSNQWDYFTTQNLKLDSSKLLNRQFQKTAF